MIAIVVPGQQGLKTIIMPLLALTALLWSAEAAWGRPEDTRAE